MFLENFLKAVLCKGIPLLFSSCRFYEDHQTEIFRSLPNEVKTHFLFHIIVPEPISSNKTALAT